MFKFLNFDWLNFNMFKNELEFKEQNKIIFLNKIAFNIIAIQINVLIRIFLF